MSKFFTKLYTCLRSVNTIDQIIKIGIVFAFLFVGFIFEPFVIFGASLLIMIFVFENNIRSFYHIIFFFPTGVAFFFNSVDIFYFVSLFFVIWHLIKYLINVRLRIYKDWLFISFFVFCLFLLLSQFLGDSNYDRVGMIAHLLFLVFVCVKSIDKLTIKNVALFLTLGIFVSAFLGLFVNIISKLEVLILFRDRFSGLMTNPNSFYTLVLAALAAICTLYVRRQINRYLFWGLFAILTIIGLSTLSRAFIILYVFLSIGFVSCKLYKARKEKINIGKVVIFVFCIAAALGLAYLTPQFHAVADRVILSLNDVDTLGDPIRFDLWELYLNKWSSSASNVLFGAGFAAPIDADGIAATTVHNAFLVLFCQTGILGTILFGAAIFFLFREVHKTWSFRFETFFPMFIVIGFCMVETALFKFQFYLFLILIFLCMTKKQNINNKTSI